MPRINCRRKIFILFIPQNDVYKYCYTCRGQYLSNEKYTYKDVINATQTGYIIYIYKLIILWRFLKCLKCRKLFNKMDIYSALTTDYNHKLEFGRDTEHVIRDVFYLKLMDLAIFVNDYECAR